MPESEKPNSDDQTAEERVKRMMEPEDSTPPKPGDTIEAPKTVDEAPVETPKADEANPKSDDGVDELIDGSSEDKEADAAVTKPRDPEQSAEDAAVDDIVKTDGDSLLADQDKAGHANVVMKPNLWERFKNDWSDWWGNPRKRYATIITFVVLIVIIFMFPASRAFVLNLFGVRGTVTVQVLDSKTSLPLKGAEVTIAGQSADTNDQGNATVGDVKLGSQEMTVEKIAFASAAQKVSIKSGKQTLPAVSLKPTGTQFSFMVTDYVSGKTISGAEAENGSASAIGDKQGKILLTIPPTNKETLEVEVSAKGYRTEKVTLKTTSKAVTNVVLVPVEKVVFVTKQNGKYDLYSADVDNKNRKLLVPGTGSERDDIALSASPDGTKAALISTRDNKRNSQGYLLSTLSIVTIEDGSTQSLEVAENVRFLGWSDTKLVYGLTVAGASAANPNREKIISYDINSSKKTPLASANYFNGSVMIGNTVYYASSSGDTGTFSKITVEGTGKQVLSNQEYWTVVRTGYDTISLQNNNGWQQYTVGGSVKAGAAPNSYNDRIYLDNIAGTKSLWVDSRDGKGVLVSYDIDAKKDTTVATQAGLTYPVRWLNDTTITFRVTTPQETADYVISTAGGQAKKITDVTPTIGIAEFR